MKETRPIWFLLQLPMSLVREAIAQVSTIKDSEWEKSTLRKEDDRRLAYLSTTPTWKDYSPVEWENGFAPTRLLTGPFKDIVTRIQTALGNLKLGQAHVTQLPGFSTIFPHVDPGPYFEAYRRVQVCLDAGPKTQFICDHDVRVFQPGECWVFDNTRLHGVINGDRTTRLGMVVDSRN